MEDKSKHLKTIADVLYEAYEQPARDTLKISPTRATIFKMDKDKVAKWNKFVDDMTREELLEYIRNLPPVED